MADATGISWCDATFNPWIGCTRVSPACAHCYADALAKRYGWGADLWEPDGPRRPASESKWKEPARWARNARAGKLPDGKPNLDRHRPRVFCASLADVFEDRPDLAPLRARLFDVIYATPELDWLLLTKRPENVGRMLGPEGVGLYAVTDRPVPHPQPNVWVGVSVENSRHTWRADVLRQIPAAVRFLSCEPLLGSLYEPRAHQHRIIECDCGEGDPPVHDICRTCGNDPPDCVCKIRKPLDLTGIDWVIIGGESGTRAQARPMNPEWAREIVRAAAGEQWCTCNIPSLEGAGQHSPGCRVFSRPAVHFKQWGSWAPAEGLLPGMRYMGPSAKSGGNLLDGTTWQEFPKSRAILTPA